jgi:hypothetical protein
MRLLVRPDTVLRWHRNLIGIKANWPQATCGYSALGDGR